MKEGLRMLTSIIVMLMGLSTRVPGLKLLFLDVSARRDAISSDVNVGS